MNPTTFQECNMTLKGPPDLDESQCENIPAYVGNISGGSLDGSIVVVVAWKPTPMEMQMLIAGNPVYLTAIGGLPPHLLTTSFKDALNIA